MLRRKKKATSKLVKGFMIIWTPKTMSTGGVRGGGEKRKREGGRKRREKGSGEKTSQRKQGGSLGG